MYKLIIPILLATFLGCSHTNTDTVTLSPDSIQATKVQSAKRIVPPGSKEIAQSNWSFVVPDTYKNVSASKPFDVSLLSDNGILKVSFFSRESSRDLSSFFMTYNSIVGPDALLVRVIGGTINGKRAMLAAYATQPSTVTIAFLTVDSKKEYALQCTMSVDDLKVYGQKCLDITESIIIK
jgi:hypothetical protein